MISELFHRYIQEGTSNLFVEDSNGNTLELYKTNNKFEGHLEVKGRFIEIISLPLPKLEKVVYKHFPRVQILTNQN